MADPTDYTIAGSISINILMDDDGDYTTDFIIDGMPTDAAIGYLVTVTDRLRKEREYEWATCPECQEPWDSHRQKQWTEDDE